MAESKRTRHLAMSQGAAIALFRCLQGAGVFTDVLSLSLASRFVAQNPAPDNFKLPPEGMTDEQINERCAKPYPTVVVTAATFKMMQEAVSKVIAAGVFPATRWIGELIDVLKIANK